MRVHLFWRAGICDGAPGGQAWTKSYPNVFATTSSTPVTYPFGNTSTCEFNSGGKAGSPGVVGVTGNATSLKGAKAAQLNSQPTYIANAVCSQTPTQARRVGRSHFCDHFPDRLSYFGRHLTPGACHQAAIPACVQNGTAESYPKARYGGGSVCGGRSVTLFFLCETGHQPRPRGRDHPGRGVLRLLQHAHVPDGACAAPILFLDFF